MDNKDCVSFKEGVYCFIGYLAEQGYLEFTEDMDCKGLESLVNEFCKANDLKGGDCKWTMSMKVPNA